MKTMHELFDGSDTDLIGDLLGAFLNTVDENTTLGDAFMAGMYACNDSYLISGVDEELHSPSKFINEIDGKALAFSGC